MKRGIASQPGSDESVVSYNGVAICIRDNVKMVPIDIQNAVYARGTIDLAELSQGLESGYPIIVDTLRARCTDNAQRGKKTEWIHSFTASSPFACCSHSAKSSFLISSRSLH